MGADTPFVKKKIRMKSNASIGLQKGSLSFSRILFRRIQFVAIYVVIVHFVAR